MMTRLFGAVFGGAQAGNVKMVSPADVRQWIDAGQAVVIDVREVNEHAAERIKGAINLPLSTFEVSQLPAIPEGKAGFPLPVRPALRHGRRQGGGGRLQW